MSNWDGQLSVVYITLNADRLLRERLGLTGVSDPLVSLSSGNSSF